MLFYGMATTVDGQLVSCFRLMDPLQTALWRIEGWAWVAWDSICSSNSGVHCFTQV